MANGWLLSVSAVSYCFALLGRPGNHKTICKLHGLFARLFASIYMRIRIGRVQRGAVSVTFMGKLFRSFVFVAAIPLLVFSGELPQSGSGSNSPDASSPSGGVGQSQTSKNKNKKHREKKMKGANGSASSREHQSGTGSGSSGGSGAGSGSKTPQ
jgi:hypothetical protein